MDNIKFGNEIKRIRESKNLTIRGLALHSGISSAYISKIENHKRNIPKIDTLQKLAKGLRISNDEMYKLAGINISDNNDKEKVETKKEQEDLAEMLDNARMYQGKVLSDEQRETMKNILKAYLGNKNE